MVMIDDKNLEQVNGGQEIEIVFSTKDLSPDTSQDIQPYTEPNEMKIMPFVENTQQTTIQKFEEPKTTNFSREAPEEIKEVRYLYRNPKP